MNRDDLTKAIADLVERKAKEGKDTCFVGILVMEEDGYAVQTLYHQKECHVAEAMHSKVWPEMMEHMKREMGAIDDPRPIAGRMLS